MLDPAALPIRASSRAYRSNESNHERVHLEHAISYLRSAPAAEEAGGPMTRDLNTLLARLELRKTLLGGFFRERAINHLAEEETIKAERIRARNWELLRQWSEKGGLYFEPFDLAAKSEQFGILWCSVTRAASPQSPGVHAVWKLLHLKNPWSDARLRQPSRQVYSRSLDENGSLLRPGLAGIREVQLIPLAVYSLTYPNAPLLMVDFRDDLRLKLHEMTQRTVNEVTAWVIGISHFTNWYYYVAADAYNFVSSRHGGATSQADRLAGCV